jgi:hypothetical protein
MVAENDDGGNCNLMSLIDCYSATSTGLYYVVVSGYTNSVGDYTLSYKEGCVPDPPSTTTSEDPGSSDVLYTVERQWRDGGNCIGCGNTYTWIVTDPNGLTPSLYDTVVVDPNAGGGLASMWVGVVTTISSGTSPNNPPIIVNICNDCTTGTCNPFTMTNCDDTGT